ncbi:hypothetical protein LG322_11595 [Microbacterium aerolatum]|uniref:hypothetical protein n=1 Tax=Microbacterium aerolatum TaxID=153731 RepID=UPI003850CA86
MSAEDASSELRMLRAKAYGPGGGLSSDELMRLQELEGRLRLPSVAQPVSSAAAPQPPLNDPQEVTPHQEELFPRVVERAERVETATPAPDPSTGSGTDPRRRRPAVVGAAAALLAVGLGVGWGIWGWNSHQFALAAAHGEERAELEASGDFDPGTVVPVAEQHGVVVWRADRSEGEELCVIVTSPDQTQHGCVTYEDLENSAWPTAGTLIPEGEEKAGSQFYAGLIPRPAGELVPFIQVWDQSDSSSWESQYSEEELAQLRELEAAGYEPGALSVLGYDGDTVVWSTWENSGLCLLVPTGGDIAEACANDFEETITLIISTAGGDTEYVVRQTDMRGPQLTIVRHPTAVTVDPETGDVIEFSVDEPMFDDLVIDDKTGDVEQ